MSLVVGGLGAEAQSKDTGVAKVRVLYSIGNANLAGTPKDHRVQLRLHTEILNA